MDGELSPMEKPDPVKRTQSQKELDKLAFIRERFSKAEEADFTERQRAEDDLLFVDGEDQWDPFIRKNREDDNRPCITINKLSTFVDQVVGDQRQNRPCIKAIGVDSKADPKIAEIITGIIKNIEVTSNAEDAYDTAFECAVVCGRGFLRIVTEYAGVDQFDQDIKIKRIANPFTVYLDPNSDELDLSDAEFAFISETLSRDEFKNRFPDAQLVDFTDLPLDAKAWYTADTVRVAEYFEKTIEKKTIYLKNDGTVTDKDPGKNNTKNQREAEIPKIQSYFVSGLEIIDGPHDWPSKFFPIVPVWGKELNVNGERRTRGLVRHAQDAQRMYNYFRSAAVETVALAPKSPFVMEETQIGVHAKKWQSSNIKAWPYLLYKHVDGVPPPQRQYPEPMNSAIAGEVMTSDQDMRDTTGLQHASLGMVSNERSGKAIEARRAEGDRGTFPFVDNLTRAMKQVGRVIVDLIPTIYDHDRVVRIRGEDGVDQFAPVNVTAQEMPQVQQQIKGKPVMMGAIHPETQVLNDLTVGKYDVVVTVGPSYATQRLEAANSMIAFAGAVPNAAPVMADLMASTMDWPGAEKIAKRLKKTIPPHLLDPSEMEEGGPPPQPDPMNDPKVALEMVKLQLKERELALKEVEVMSRAALNIAKAEGVEKGQQLDLYMKHLDFIKTRAEQQTKALPQGQPTPQGEM